MIINLDGYLEFEFPEKIVEYICNNCITSGIGGCNKGNVIVINNDVYFENESTLYEVILQLKNIEFNLNIYVENIAVNGRPRRVIRIECGTNKENI